MLAKCDKHGIVYASVPGLADAARVGLEHCQDALLRLAAPDKWSRSKEEDGKRIIEVDGGWMLINHAKYKRIKDADERRAYVAEKVAEYRAKQKDVNNVNNVNSSKPGKHIRSDQIRSDNDIYSDDFLEFWKSYPRKVGKGGAWKIWKRLNPDIELLNKMIDAVNGQKKTVQWKDVNFIPHPETWLNKRKWEDEISESPKSKGFVP